MTSLKGACGGEKGKRAGRFYTVKGDLQSLCPRDEYSPASSHSSLQLVRCISFTYCFRFDCLAYTPLGPGRRNMIVKSPYVYRQPDFGLFSILPSFRASSRPRDLKRVE